MSSGLIVKALRSTLAGPFDFSLTAGSCAAITGPSGSGKSLLLRMMADLDHNEGDVRLGDRERAGMPATEWRKLVTYVAAESGWWAETVLEHFHERDRAAARLLIDRMGLKADLFGAPVMRLSTGEKQRLALSRALLLNPPALLLDEPTSALDDESTQRVEEILGERQAQGMCLVLVTHDPRQAQRLGHQHYRMVAGKLEAA